jgi:ferredoxin
MTYINPEECIDCGACEPICPVETITAEDDTLPEDAPFGQENAGSSPRHCLAEPNRWDHPVERSR